MVWANIDYNMDTEDPSGKCNRFRNTPASPRLQLDFQQGFQMSYKHNPPANPKTRHQVTSSGKCLVGVKKLMLNY